MLDNYEIRPRKFIGVCVSLNNCRLFIGSIPKDKRKDEIMEEMEQVQHPPHRQGRSQTHSFLMCRTETGNQSDRRVR